MSHGAELRINGWTATRISSPAARSIEILDRDRFIVGAVASFDEAEAVIDAMSEGASFLEAIGAPRAIH